MSYSRLFACIALTAVSLSATACEAVLLGASLADDEGDTGSGDGDGDYFSSEGNTDIEAARFSADIGQVSDFSADADATAYDDGEYASITLTALQGGWGAMVAFDLSGADRDALFTAGSAITISEASGSYAYACSGDESNPYGYETSQSAGTIVISEAENGMLQVDFTMTYGGSDTATGSFQLEAR